MIVLQLIVLEMLLFAFVNITIIFQINIFCYIARTTNIIQLFFCNDDLFDADDEEKKCFFSNF